MAQELNHLHLTKNRVLKRFNFELLAISQKRVFDVPNFLFTLTANEHLHLK